MLPYSWSTGQTPSRNWQKSFLIPNHPEKQTNQADLVKNLALNNIS
jgi:hypothetical protein